MLTTEYFIHGHLLKRVGVVYFDPVAPGDPMNIDSIDYRVVSVGWVIRGLRANDRTGEHTQRVQQIHLVAVANPVEPIVESAE